MSACSDSGVQGTSLYSSFQGIGGIEVISPTTLKLTWNLDSKYSEYRVYQNGGVSPLKSENFSSTMITGLIPGTLYTYQVTGVAGGSELLVGGSMSATTLTSFTGLTSGGVTLKSPTEVNLTWNMNSSNTEYRLFKKKRSETWNLTAAEAVVKGSNQYVVTSLTPGETYCFYIQASYADQTKEPTMTAEADVNAVAPCLQMTSQMSALPSVTVSSVIPGEFPWFWTALGNPNYKTEIYELDTDVRVASRTGNGPFRAFVKGVEGTKNYYALVSNDTQIAKLPVSLDGKQIRTSSKIRTLNTSGDRGPLQPPLFNGGYGQQNFGKQVVVGDFNCDGLPDLAISMPTAVIVPSSKHYTQTGAVVVYYGYQPPSGTTCFDSNGNALPSCPMGLKTDVAPSASATYPNPTLITFSATSDAMIQGRVLQVGNYNGDCYERGEINPHQGSCNSLYGSVTAAEVPYIHRCEDLAIGIGDGSFYVVYGNPLQGLVAGSGATTAGEDEFTCDSFSNTCRVARMLVPSGYDGYTFGSAMAMGDYNNDGYDDLAVSANVSATGLSNVLVYRGSSQGLYPYGMTGSHATITSGASGTTGLTAVTSTDSFGAAIGTMFGSRKCVNDTPVAGMTFRSSPPAQRAGYDFTRCDDVVVGAPARSSGRGSIFSCKGTNPSSGSDRQQITGWTCAEHYPNTATFASTGTVQSYGATILGVRNFNGYPIDASHLKSNPSNSAGEVPEISGALFVGAPDSSVISSGTAQAKAGAVFAYYLGPYVPSNAQSYSGGGIQGMLGSGVHALEAFNTVACDRINGNVDFTNGYRCQNQVLTMSPPESGAGFGTRIGYIPITSAVTPLEQTMHMLAVAAPYRNVTRSDGSGTATAGGSVYLYKADLSTFGSEGGTPISMPQRSIGVDTRAAGYSCTTTCTWYSGGVSPFGPTVVYPGNLVDNANFGLGGIVGGSFNNDDAGDLVASAPNLDSPTPKNGAAYIFNSNGGFGPSENAPAVQLNTNIALEGGYQFQDAKVVGDINGDGYDDVVTHINANGVWSIAVYYGSPLGLVKSPAPSTLAQGSQPLLVKLPSDANFGIRFAAIGDVNGDGFKDILVVGSKATYVYYGSSSGLVTTPEPAVSPIGKGPLKFATVVSGTQYANFSGSDSWSSAIADNASYKATSQGITSGDFNSDGYDDIVIHVPTNDVPGGATGSNLSYLAGQMGRAYVIYGSVNGPQVNRLTGTIRLKDGSNNAVDVVVEDPCTSTGTCKIQIIGPPHTASTNGFAYAAAAVRRKTGPTYPIFDRLLLSDPNASSNLGAVYLFEGSLTGLKSSIVQKLVPRTGTANQRFGLQIANVGDLNGDQYLDVAISTGMTSNPLTYVFYGATVGGAIAYYGESTLNAGDFWASPAIANNDEIADPAKPRPQVLAPTSVSTDLSGWGIAGLGDFNNDGYDDFAVNIPNVDSTQNGLVSGTGSVVIYFGTANGVKSKNIIVSPYPRCYRGDTPLCEPFQVFLPGAAAYENTFIGPDSVGDLNGDGLKDLIIGGVGRDLSVSGQRSATSTGVIFPLY